MRRTEASPPLAGVGAAAIRQAGSAATHQPIATGKSGLSEVENASAHRAFSQAPNPVSSGLKNGKKALFIQHLTLRYFALGASHLSWHN
jgi:hypothetical protein